MAQQPFKQPLRALGQAAAVLIFLGLLAVPPAAVAAGGTASVDALWTALRILGLEAFTIVFANITTGSFRPFFNRVAKPRLVHRIHTVTGVTGFSLAVAHGVSVLVFGIAGYRPEAFWVGPAALAVLAVVIATALLRGRFRRAWRWIHRANYAIFVAVLVHGLLIGADLRSTLFLKVCVGVYTAVVLAGLAYRLTRPALRPAKKV